MFYNNGNELLDNVKRYLFDDEVNAKER